MINKLQVQMLKATGKVDDVEDEGMDEGRFFVHLKPEYTWDSRFERQASRSFGSFREAFRAVKKTATLVTE